MDLILNVFLVIIGLLYVCGSSVFNGSQIHHSESELLVRKARWLPLIFPRADPTRLEMIVGFGIPVEDLKIESVVTGYVFKAQYYLPYSARQLRIKNIHGINERELPANATIFQKIMQKTDEELGVTSWDMDENVQALASYRWTVYEAFQALAIRMNLQGRECILKSICESAAAPFDERNGLLGELLHILLTPSSSVDPLSEHSDNDYLQAERLGEAGTDCDQVFQRCPKSLLQHFSDVHHLGSEFLKMFG
ncbi:uncharacterized protein LOC111070562 [Drosophila obscura]|uniref:uncharacterized protein LOC111070562 n=1 Tax=Drosophila obscura TaxID=7282 RepID=UPI001BB2B3B2|nr:uncharacterized protein LOC111070562 [Drosophila obscura]